MKGLFYLAKTLLLLVRLNPGRVYLWICKHSLIAAHREQNLSGQMDRLREIVPDPSDQYTDLVTDSGMDGLWEIKMRGLHAFQTQAGLDALTAIGKHGLTVMDVGDSSGNHGIYLETCAPKGVIERFVAVNLDPEAVAKIRSKGREAHLVRAEKITEQGIQPDLLISFETLEHLTDPLRFLHSVSTEAKIEHALVSVPYCRQSRFGGDILRNWQASDGLLSAERTHLFELSVQDWKLLARLGGYRTRFERVYLQYPRFGLWRLTRRLWKSTDFEGFLVLFLERDTQLTNRYNGW